MNSEHQGSVNKVNMENLFCESCHYYRPQMKELKNRRILPGLSLISESDRHVRNLIEEQRIPAKYISDLFFIIQLWGFWKGVE